VAPTKTEPSHWTPTRLRDVDGRIEVLATELARTTNADRRAELLDAICRLALPLADGIALRYRGRGIEVDDLMQVARTALVKAVTRYRPGSGRSFTAFASPTVSGEVKRWFRDHGWSVRPPRRLQELRVLVSTQGERLRHELGREPTRAELADALAVAESEVSEAQACSAGYHALSLDVPTVGGTAVGEHLLATSAPFATVDSLDALNRALPRLTDRQRRVLHLRFVEELTQSEIADTIGVSQMQVSRVLSSTLASLREELCHDDTDHADHAA
jgi:RNA polymerase sigma-B factor